MILDMSSLSPSKVYFTITQTIIPRPVAWIMTNNKDASLNLAPFSYFNAICSDPPLVVVSIGTKPNGTQKDSLNNLLEQKHCIIHLADMASIDDVNESSRDYQSGQSEVSALNLATTACDDFPVPRLSNSPIALACSFYKNDVIGNSKQNIVYLEIEHIYYQDDVVTFQANPFRLTVDALKVDPLCRLGSGDYANLEQTHRRKRPS